MIECPGASRNRRELALEFVTTCNNDIPVMRAPTTAEQTRAPIPIRILNRLGAALERVGVRSTSPTAERLIEKAKRQSGLEGFGELRGGKLLGSVAVEQGAALRELEDSVPGWQRALTRLELYVYATAYAVSGWFTDDTGFFGGDPLLSEQRPEKAVARQGRHGQSFAA